MNTNQPEDGPTSSGATVIERYFALAPSVSEPNVSALRRRLNLLFGGIDLSGKSVLDVGGGTGLISFFAAASGATPVVCLEPGEAGSNPRMEAMFQAWRDGLGDVAKVQLLRSTFQEHARATGSSYDVVVVHNAINHLDEEACASLSDDPNARATYLAIFRDLHRLTRPGGSLLIADAARRNAWDALGIRSPFAPTIEWRIHAQPSVWAGIAREAGFTLSRTSWRAHSRLGQAGQTLLGNPLGAWLTNSSFMLQLGRS